MRQLCKGNVAVVKGAILAGCRAYYGYPITPASEIAEAAALYFPQVGGTFIQAESEVAAINMVYGAAAAGVQGSPKRPGLRALRCAGRIITGLLIFLTVGLAYCYAIVDEAIKLCARQRAADGSSVSSGCRDPIPTCASSAHDDAGAGAHVARWAAAGRPRAESGHARSDAGCRERRPGAAEGRAAEPVLPHQLGAPPACGALRGGPATAGREGPSARRRRRRL